jgi:Xaa-Pro dipeptidase
VSHGLIFIAGQPTVNWRDSDQSRPFRQRRYFYYLSGVDEPDCALTYDIGLDILTLYVPDFDLRRAIWMGPTLSREDAQDRYDVDRVLYQSSLQPELVSWLSERVQSSLLYMVHESETPEGLPAELPLDAKQLMPAMDAARGVKDEYEIRMIRKANKVSGLAHRKILESIQKMSNESQIEGSFLNTCISHGAPNQAYQIIAASGPNAAVLHYDRNNESLKNKPLVCLDAGAEWQCYASDVTRTFPLSGEWPSKYARDIYRVVERMQEECIKRIRRGNRFLYTTWPTKSPSSNYDISVSSRTGVSPKSEPRAHPRSSSLTAWATMSVSKSTTYPSHPLWLCIPTLTTINTAQS